ncbi:unnamed protein product [Paramecium sonneborni]|uniref:Uncharacterized protein n=1 Tax=Paramecium sonneborni TaxID=65129 RepID=A0A8S1R7A3_9CILI|nr:unnamed protein product [Paramecium sonneborni]
MDSKMGVLEFMIENQHRKITQNIKCSINSEYQALGYHDNCKYINKFPEFVIHLKPFRKHKKIDFSFGYTKLISTCRSYDLIFWDVTNYCLINSNTPIQVIWHIMVKKLIVSLFAPKQLDNYYLLAVDNYFQ